MFTRDRAPTEDTVVGLDNEGRRGSGHDALQHSTLRRETGDTIESANTFGTEYTDTTDALNEPPKPIETGYGLPPERQTGEAEILQNADKPFQVVNRDLRPWQIFFIVISGTIGLGLFTDSGEILRLAGPAGALLAFTVVGAAVISIMAGIAEMIDHWPISNALVEFVRSFVDDDLALLLGVAYWLAYSLTFGTLLSAMIDLGSYWNWVETWRFLVCGVLAPILALVINMMGVRVYGWIESIMGMFKLLLVFSAFLIMLVINAGGGPSERIGSKYINQGFKSDNRITSSAFVAVLASIPIAAYAFAGVEIIAVTALEAKDPAGSLKRPVSSLAKIIAGVYLTNVLGFYLNVCWQDSNLPSILGRANGEHVSGSSILIIAAANSRIPFLADFLNGCLMATVFSAANTALYVASRTLFGLARDLNYQGSLLSQIFSHFGTTMPSTHVPAKAVVLSFFVGAWIPWAHAGLDYEDQWLQEVLSGIATVSVILVWASQCWAYIRYRKWISMHRLQLGQEYERYSYRNLNSGYLSHFQPLLAWFGFISCLATALLFSTASWWKRGKPTPSNVVAAWTVPVLLLVLWLALKTFSLTGSKQWVVTFSKDPQPLKDEIIRLERMIKDNSGNSSVGTTPQTRRSGWHRNHNITSEPTESSPLDTVSRQALPSQQATEPAAQSLLAKASGSEV